MSRKYQKEFEVKMTAKVEDGDMTEAQIKRELKEKASSVYDMKLEIDEVKQTYPAPQPPKTEAAQEAAPAPTAEAPATTAEQPAPTPAAV